MKYILFLRLLKSFCLLILTWLYISFYISQFVTLSIIFSFLSLKAFLNSECIRLIFINLIFKLLESLSFNNNYNSIKFKACKLKIILKYFQFLSLTKYKISIKNFIVLFSNVGLNISISGNCKFPSFLRSPYLLLLLIFI